MYVEYSSQDKKHWQAHNEHGSYRQLFVSSSISPLVAFILNKWCDEFNRRPSPRYLFHRPVSVCSALFIDLIIDLFEDFVELKFIFLPYFDVLKFVCVHAQIKKVIPIPNQSIIIIRKYAKFRSYFCRIFIIYISFTFFGICLAFLVLISRRSIQTPFQK